MTERVQTEQLENTKKMIQFPPKNKNKYNCGLFECNQCGPSPKKLSSLAPPLLTISSQLLPLKIDNKELLDFDIKIQRNSFLG